MKTDYDEFQEFLAELPAQLSLDRIRARWAKYAFHFTDIRNVAKILIEGKIRCRANLPKGGFVDAASPNVIAHTDSGVKTYVRLYFRPRTPTQYRSEGIRPRAHLWKDSHCPVPVFLLFDLLQLLVRDDSRFSDGNLAKLGFDGLCSSAAELSTFDFRKIYHGTWVSNEEREDIVSHRNAEIVVPNELDLSQLKLIYCRSAAEKETLLYLLPANIRDRWAPKIAIETTATLYYRQWAFVESATLSNDSIVLNFSPDAEQAGPFDLTLVRNSSDRQTLSIKDFYANKRTEIKFKSNVWTYDIEVYLDEHLAFAESYDGSDEIPF